MSEKTNESRLRGAGLRMALKLVPDDLIQQAPATIEKHLLNKLAAIEPMTGESGSCFLLAPDNTTGALRLMTVTLDEKSRVSRIIDTTTLGDLFRQILDNLKEL